MNSTAPGEASTPDETRYLSDLLGQNVRDGTGKVLGRVRDLIVRLRGEDYPLLTALIVAVGSESIYVPISDVVALEAGQVTLTSARLDVRPFARRAGEVLLSADVLGHRLIDVENTDFVRARDVRLRRADRDWVVVGLDVRRRRWFPSTDRSRISRDWKSFEALIGHAPTLLFRSSFGRIRRFRPAEIADLLENATPPEQTELLAQVHDDPELEADVFEELDEDRQAQLLRTRPIDEVAGVLARMRADDAADAVAQLPQDRRQPVLDLLPPGQRTKILTLLGYNTATAGGLMTLEYLALPERATIDDALERIKTSTGQQPEALTTIYILDDDGHLNGGLTLVEALQHDPATVLGDVAGSDPVHAFPGDDIVDITTRMADFNLLTLPVVDEEHRLLGIITVDDALEAAIPEDWRRRTRHTHTNAVPVMTTSIELPPPDRTSNEDPQR
ncbi:MAG: CBS domain-containing protein [Actinomycetota bacterium]|nr:CBS domain-containing protein [Actinomycetota bacterium]